jgi:hypothetical protein
MEICDKCGKTIEDKWNGINVSGEEIICNECIGEFLIEE